MSMLKVVRLAFAAAVLSTIGFAPAMADSYPEKPITLIIPLGAGGSHDLNARAFTSVIPTYLGQAVVVKLMPGAGGQTGTAAAVQAKADGHTLLFTHNYIDQLQQHVEKLPYNPTKDLVTVARLNYATASIVVRADKPWKTLKEMFDYGKANPGKLVFGHSGNWGAIMAPGALILKEAGVDATLVPFKGGGPAMKALLSGDSDFTMAFPSVIEGQGDNIRTLASGGEARLFKDVPTLKELGFSADTGLMHRVVMAPRGISEDHLKVLAEAFEKLNGDKTYKKLMGRLGENTELMSGKDYEAVRTSQSGEYKKLVEKLTGN